MIPAADEFPFLEAALRRPADDAPRLVYADFLDARDDPADRARADLIRVQCALARLMPEHPRRAELADREADLLQRHRAGWAAPLRGLAVGVEFRRGLPDVVAVDAGTLLARGAELFRLTAVGTLPVLRRVKLLDAAGVVEQLAASPLLARVPELDLCGNGLENGGLHLLLRSPHLGHLEHLDLSFNNLDDRAVALLARGTSLRSLRSLHLNDNDNITGEGAAKLAASPAFAGLHTLDLSGNAVGEAGVAALADGRYLARLHTLKLAGNPVGDAGAAALAGSPLLKRLLDREPRLDLRRAGVGPTGAAAIAESPAADRLVALDLTSNHLADDGAAAVAGCPRLTRLRTLRLGQNQIADGGAQALARSALLGRLKHLDLSDNRITRRGVQALYAARTGPEPVLELKNNLQASDGGSAADPLTHGPLFDTLLGGLADLRRRVSHPARMNPPPPRPGG